MKTLKTIALLLVSLFVFTSLSNTVFALSTKMQTAIEATKKVEEKKKQYDKSLEKVKVQLTSLANKYISQKRETVLIKKYESIIKKIDTLVLKQQNTTSIYKGVTIDLLNGLKNFIVSENVRLKKSIDDRKKKFNGVEVGSTTEEKKEIIEKVVEKSTTQTESVSETFDNRRTLEANGLSYKEATLLSFKTQDGDGFQFCANFPSEVYTNYGQRNYVWASSSPMDVSDAYRSFTDTYHKNQYTDAMANWNGARIQKCVRRMYIYSKDLGVTQKDIETIYEKYYGEYVPYTTPYYLDDVQPENIETYIKNHHKK